MLESVRVGGLPAGGSVRLGGPALAIVCAAGLLAGCAAADAAGGEVRVRADAIGLSDQQAEGVGRLRYLAGYRLSSADQRFGGFSGLWLTPDGSRLIAASDAGTFWQAPLDHSEDGTLAGFGPFRVTTPAIAPGDPRHPKDQNIEALTVDETGRLVLAYEGTHRIRCVPLDDLGAEPDAVPTPAGLGQHGNRGIEALVSLADGLLLALSEGGRRPDDAVPAWQIGADETWMLGYRPQPGFAPTGADRLGERIFILERRFSWLGGFQSRIVELPAASVAPGVVLEGEQLGALQPPLRTENFEAIAVREGPDGRTLIYILSDDNFNLLQSTLLLQFEVVPGS